MVVGLIVSSVVDLAKDPSPRKHKTHFKMARQSTSHFSYRDGPIVRTNRLTISRRRTRSETRQEFRSSGLSFGPLGNATL